MQQQQVSAVHQLSAKLSAGVQEFRGFKEDSGVVVRLRKQVVWNECSIKFQSATTSTQASGAAAHTLVAAQRSSTQKLPLNTVLQDTVSCPQRHWDHAAQAVGAHPAPQGRQHVPVLHPLWGHTCTRCPMLVWV